MGEDDIHRLGDDLRIDLLRAAHELAAARVALTMRRWGVDLKYSQTQPRVPAGQREGGQWAGGQGGALKGRSKRARAMRAAAKLVAQAVATNPEAAAMALRAAGLPAVAGTVGISRSAGLASVVASGGAGQIGGEGMTPILGIPFDLPVTMGNQTGNSFDHLTPAEQNTVIDRCEPTYEGLAKICRAIKSPVRAQACWAHASEILSQCIQDETEQVRASRRK